MLLSMSRFQIIGTKRCQAKTIQHLHRLGAVQIAECVNNSETKWLNKLRSNG